MTENTLLAIIICSVFGGTIFLLILWAIISNAAGAGKRNKLLIAQMHLMARIAKQNGADEKEINDLIKYGQE